ncbi:MAG: Sua5 family C-terminal domain-containing protein [Myxococcota bacterium]
MLAELSGRIAAVVDGGACAVGVESTVVAVAPGGALRLLRPGAVSRDALAEVGPVTLAAGDRASPGHTASHYAPATPVVLLDAPAVPEPGPVAVLAATDPGLAEALTAAGHDVRASRVLSARGDPEEAARGLFAALRALDSAGVARILVEPWPSDAGLGHAIRDRLRRAAGRG